MKRIIATGLLLALFPAAMAGPSTEGKVFPFEYKLVQLDNGFKAYFINTGYSGQIAYVTVVRTGSREEWEEGRSGYAHFFEHMMFAGTEKYPDYAAETIKLGASRNAFTNNNFTCYYMVTASASLEKVMDLESNRFLNMNYSEATYKNYATPVLGEYNQGRASPFRYLDEKMREVAFDKHTYRHTTIGYEADVRNMPNGYDYSLSFFKNYYRPENCVLLLAGEFDMDNAEALLHKFYDEWKPGYVTPKIQQEPPQTAPREQKVTFPGRTSPILAVSYKGPAWSATDRLAVACEVLGQVAFGQNSEIYRKLVVQEQLAQSFSSDFDLVRDPWLLSIFALAPKADALDTIAVEIQATIDHFRENPCDPVALDRTKKAIKYGFLNNLETARGAAFSLLSIVSASGGIEAVEDYFTTLDSLTPADLQQAAQTYLVENSRSTVTLLSKGE